MPLTIHAVLVLVMLAVLIGAAIEDGHHRMIADTWSVLVIGLFIADAVAARHFPMWDQLAAPLVVFAVGLLAFHLGLMGGGDIKLISAVSMWTGLAGIPVFLCGTFLAGGALAIYAFAIAMMQQRSWRVAIAAVNPLPYAAAIFVGGLLWSQLFV